ncbi:MAG: glycosyltransferase [Dissulfurispiraceae bacterium]|jgi:spore maturation protein CgeB|nr:glycosyltransferase [Dissulfurispiraceae bacterium]
MGLRVLTFNWHEAYITLLAKTGHEFDVVQKWKGGRFGWMTEFRPVPQNCRLITEDEAKAKLADSEYDRVICHNVEDLVFTLSFKIPKVYVFHNKLTTEIGLGGNAVDRNDYLVNIKKLFAASAPVLPIFISESKRSDWGLDGEIIMPGIDPAEYGGWSGSEKKVLRIGNLLKERDLMLGFNKQEQILRGIPSTILGLNPTIPESTIPDSWESLKAYMKAHRVYLNTCVHPYEDGYNLALLETMATGMPVVSIANPTSPIVDSVNGFISDDYDYLHEKVQQFMKDHEFASNIGSNAVETVREKFPIDKFIASWNDALSFTVRTAHHYSSKYSEQAKIKLKILMSYTSNPQTTAAYLEKALRKFNSVITYGPKLSDDVLKAWDLELIKERIKDHDIPYKGSDTAEVLKHLPEDWHPDIFLWVESGVWFPMENLESLPCVKACYLIDTHLNLETHLKIARPFDFVFLAQRAYIPRFIQEGYKNVYWLPLGCDVDMHGKRSDTKKYEIGFVGSLNNENRIRLLDILSQNLTVHYERAFLERMSEVFSESKIVFNNCVKDDLNMRVFEALCSGSMLLTDEARGSGLTEMFTDKKHLVIYRNDEEMLEFAKYYLENDKEREDIAAAGMQEVLAKHTYDHRALELVKKIAANAHKIIQNESESKMMSLSDIEKKPLDYYSQPREEVITLVPESARKILDIGCGEGVLGEALLSQGAEEVVGVEINSNACDVARKKLTDVICGDIENINLPYAAGYFDCIIMADVIEHCREPLKVLQKLSHYLNDCGRIVASIPNVRYWGICFRLISEGRWEYEDSGILDKTHLRFFTKKEIEILFSQVDFEIEAITANMDPRYKNIPKQDLTDFRFGNLIVENVSEEDIKDLFSVQYILRAKKSVCDSVMLSVSLQSEMSDTEKKLALDEYLTVHPGDLSMLFKHAEICYKTGLYEEALESIEKVIIFDPDMKGAMELRNKIVDAG